MKLDASKALVPELTAAEHLSQRLRSCEQLLEARRSALASTLATVEHMVDDLESLVADLQAASAHERGLHLNPSARSGQGGEARYSNAVPALQQGEPG